MVHILKFNGQFKLKWFTFFLLLIKLTVCDGAGKGFRSDFSLSPKSDDCIYKDRIKRLSTIAAILQKRLITAKKCISQLTDHITFSQQGYKNFKFDHNDRSDGPFLYLGRQFVASKRDKRILPMMRVGVQQDWKDRTWSMKREEALESDGAQWSVKPDEVIWPAKRDKTQWLAKRDEAMWAGSVQHPSERDEEPLPVIREFSDACRSLCGACKRQVSLRWGVRCMDECTQKDPGMAMDVCFVVWATGENPYMS